MKFDKWHLHHPLNGTNIFQEKTRFSRSLKQTLMFVLPRSVTLFAHHFKLSWKLYFSYTIHQIFTIIFIFFFDQTSCHNKFGTVPVIAQKQAVVLSSYNTFFLLLQECYIQYYFYNTVIYNNTYNSLYKTWASGLLACNICKQLYSFSSLLSHTTFLIYIETINSYKYRLFKILFHIVSYN